MEDIIFTAGGGFLFGAVAGYAFKKLMKLAVLVLGLFVVALMYLSYKGWFDVKWIPIENAAKSTLTDITNQGIIALNNTSSFPKRPFNNRISRVTFSSCFRIYAWTSFWIKKRMSEWTPT